MVLSQETPIAPSPTAAGSLSVAAQFSPPVNSGEPIAALLPTINMWLASLLAMNKSLKVLPSASATLTPAVYRPGAVIPGKLNEIGSVASPAKVLPASS